MKRTVLFFLLVCFGVLGAACQSGPKYELERDASKNPILTPSVARDIVDHYAFEEVLTGESFTIRDLKGKFVIVDFWQTWCAPCIKNFKQLQAIKGKWPDRVEVLAASPDWADSPRQIKRFIKNNDYDFTFVLAGDLEQRLELNSIPYKFMVDENGKLVSLDAIGADEANLERFFTGLLEK